MLTAAEAAFNSIPTVHIPEAVRIVVDGASYHAQEIFAPIGSRAFAYTDASGTVRIVRFKTAERAVNLAISEPSDAPVSNPFADAPLVSLDTQIENVEHKLEPLIRNAETGEHWAEIARIEAAELAPLLKLKVNQRIRDLHDRARQPVTMHVDRGFKRETTVACTVDISSGIAGQIDCIECGGDGDWTKFHPEPHLGPFLCVDCKGTGRVYVSI